MKDEIGGSLGQRKGDGGEVGREGHRDRATVDDAKTRYAVDAVSEPASAHAQSALVTYSESTTPPSDRSSIGAEQHG